MPDPSLTTPISKDDVDDHGGTPHDDNDADQIAKTTAMRTAIDTTTLEAAPPVQPPAPRSRRGGPTHSDLMGGIAAMIDPEAPINVDGEVPLIEVDFSSASVRIHKIVLHSNGEITDANLPPGKPFFDNRYKV